MQDDYQITIREAAQALGISPSTCRRYLKQGKLTAFREVRSDGTERYLISRASVLALNPDAVSQLPPANAEPSLDDSSDAVTSIVDAKLRTLAPADGSVGERKPALSDRNTANDGDFLEVLEDSLEREVETHRMVPVDLYREIREKHEKVLARASQLEGQLAQALPEIEKLRAVADERLTQVAALEKEIAFLREQIEHQPNGRILPRFMGILRKA